MSLNVFVQVWSEMDPLLNARIDRLTGDPQAEEGDVLWRVSTLGRCGVWAASQLGDSEVTAFCVNERHLEALRAAIAGGASRGCDLQIEATKNRQRYVPALADWLRSRQPDLVVGDSQAGMLAGHLGWSHLAGIETFEITNGQLHAVRHLSRGDRERVRAQLPVVVRLQPGWLRPPYISRARLLAVGMDEIHREQLVASDSSPFIEPGGLQPVRPRTRGSQPKSKPSSRGRDRLAALVAGPSRSSAQSMPTANTSERTPEELADEFVRYLAHHNLLPHVPRTD